MAAWVREVAELDAKKFGTDTEGSLPLRGAVQRLRDEVTVLMMARHRGTSRELSMMLTKLDEAGLWAVLYGETLNTHVVIPRAEILRDATADIGGGPHNV